jgi:HAD superfamily hydrolase (TIGR01509 family)
MTTGDDLVADRALPADAGDDVSDGLRAVPDPGALLFDLDGTLVDTVETRIEAWMRTFAEVGIPADRGHVAGLIGADGKRLALEVAAVADRRLGDDRAEAVDRRAGEIYGELNTDPQPLPGAVELLASLERSELPWAIATSSRAEQVATSVATLGLRDDPRIIDGSHVAQAKPAPDLLLRSAEQLGIAAHRCWYVGDAVWDMLAARSAQMTGIGVTTGAVGAHQLATSGARTVVASLAELHAELGRRGLTPG